jgi:hypothetical protein
MGLMVPTDYYSVKVLRRRWKREGKEAAIPVITANRLALLLT